MHKHFLVASLALVLPAIAFGQEANKKYDFRLTLKEGDVFTDTGTDRMQMSLYVDNQLLMKNTQDASREERMTVEKLNAAGKVQQLLEETVRDESKLESERAGQSPVKRSENGPMHGVAIRYTWQDDKFAKTLVAGTQSPRVSRKLEKPEYFVLNEDVLPTAPLAVGESLEVKDAKRLADLLASFGDGTEVTKPYTIKLTEMKKVDGVPIAVLEETVQLQAKIPAGPGAAVPTLVNLKLVATYDMDRRFLSGAVMDVRAAGEITQDGRTIKLEMTGNSTRKVAKQQ